MNVDWARKSMCIVDQNTVVHLCGIQSDTSSCPTISLQECSSLIHQDEVSHVVQLNSVSVDPESENLPEVQQLLHKFKAIFAEPSALPR